MCKWNSEGVKLHRGIQQAVQNSETSVPNLENFSRMQTFEKSTIKISTTQLNTMVQSLWCSNTSWHTLTKGAYAILARRRAISVFPQPVGPIMSIFFGTISSLSPSGIRWRRHLFPAVAENPCIFIHINWGNQREKERFADWNSNQFLHYSHFEWPQKKYTNLMGWQLQSDLFGSKFTSPKKRLYEDLVKIPYKNDRVDSWFKKGRAQRYISVCTRVMGVKHWWDVWL